MVARMVTPTMAAIVVLFDMSLDLSCGLLD